MQLLEGGGAIGSMRLRLRRFLKNVCVLGRQVWGFECVPANDHEHIHLSVGLAMYRTLRTWLCDCVCLEAGGGCVTEYAWGTGMSSCVGLDEWGVSVTRNICWRSPVCHYVGQCAWACSMCFHMTEGRRWGQLCPMSLPHGPGPPLEGGWADREALG